MELNFEPMAKNSMANSSKKALSKNLLKMKFMQRASQSLDVEESDGCLIEKWVSPNVPQPPKISGRIEVVECSFVECENLNTFGRFSFNKFNKEVERLSMLHSRTGASAHQESDEDEGTIPALEVARRYEEITSRKLLGKRQRADIVDREGEKRSAHSTDKDGFMKPV